MAGPWRTRTRKPPGPARINYAHPLARDIAFFHFEAVGGASGYFYDAVTGLRGVTVSGQSEIAEGLHFNGAARSSNGTFRNPSGVTTGYLTVISRMRLTTKPVGGVTWSVDYCDASNRGPAVGFDSSGFAIGGVVGSNGYVTATDAIDHTNSWVTLAASTAYDANFAMPAGGVPVARLWIDGVRLPDSGTSGTVNNTTTPTAVIYGRESTNYDKFFTGDIEWSMGFNRFLTDAEHREIARNPWALLIPIFDPRKMSLPSIGSTLFTLLAGQGTFALTGQAAGLLRNRLLSAAQGTFALTGRAAILGRLFTLLVGQGTFGLTGKPAVLLFNRLLAAAQGTFALTGRAVGLLRNLLLPAGQGTYTLTGKSSILGRLFSLLAGQGTFALTGKPVNLLRNRLLAAAQGTFALTGRAVGFLRGLRLAAAQGTYTLAGQIVTLTYNTAAATYTILADFGSYALAGKPALLLSARILRAVQGTFALTGKIAGLFKNRTLLAGQGNIVLTGKPAGLLAARILTAVRGTFVLGGQAAGLFRNRFMLAAQGTFALTGRAAAFGRSYTLAAAVGAYTLAGQIVTLSVLNAHFGRTPRFTFTPIARIRSFTAKVRSRKFTL